MKAVSQPLPLSTLVFAGTTLACLLLAAVALVGWMNARNEAAFLRTETSLAQGAVKEAEQEIEALKIINGRQLEIIREAEEKASAKTTPSL